MCLNKENSTKISPFKEVMGKKDEDSPINTGLSSFLSGACAPSTAKQNLEDTFEKAYRSKNIMS